MFSMVLNWFYKDLFQNLDSKYTQARIVHSVPLTPSHPSYKIHSLAKRKKERHPFAFFSFQPPFPKKMCQAQARVAVLLHSGKKVMAGYM